MVDVKFILKLNLDMELILVSLSLAFPVSPCAAPAQHRALYVAACVWKYMFSILNDLFNCGFGVIFSPPYPAFARYPVDSSPVCTFYPCCT